MRSSVILLTATLTVATALAHSEECKLKPKEVVTKFMNEFYLEKRVREAFETWVEPGYIQHNPMAQTGRDAAIAFLEPFFKSHTDIHYSIKRIIADGNLVAVHSHGVFTPGERGLAIVDILRVEGCKIAEHWDVAQPVPEKSANNNGMF
ncbi:MAG TPA: nuclear transport factor 2 family protein [Steroidobacteraceae bacterium]|jgi:predicted SnoaL-like aldol condensation-catalyzing enzyme|nr:nuclear transport factor 2 family protein [Steroidobacteraceae bacterium]